MVNFYNKTKDGQIEKITGTKPVDTTPAPPAKKQRPPRPSAKKPRNVPSNKQKSTPDAEKKASADSKPESQAAKKPQRKRPPRNRPAEQKSPQKESDSMPRELDSIQQRELANRQKAGRQDHKSGQKRQQPPKAEKDAPRAQEDKDNSRRPRRNNRQRNNESKTGNESEAQKKKPDSKPGELDSIQQRELANRQKAGKQDHKSGQKRQQPPKAKKDAPRTQEDKDAPKAKQTDASRSPRRNNRQRNNESKTGNESEAPKKDPDSKPVELDSIQKREQAQKRESEPKERDTGQKSHRKNRPQQDTDQQVEKKKAPKQEAAHWDISMFDVPPEEGLTRFHDLDLTPELMHALADMKFQYCTPIQEQLLPETLAGKDASGRAPTGTGKTAAFILSVFTRMLKNPIEEKRRLGTPRCLVIAPTRELVFQILSDAQAIGKYTDLYTIAVYGGDSSRKQLDKIQRAPVDLLVATPGRLLDFKNQHKLHLGHVETMIIDEADRMLDMGFIPDVRKIINSTPPRDKRQTLLFSATLTPEVLRLATQWTKDAVSVEVAPEQVAVDTVDQRVYIVTAGEKFRLLYNILKIEKPTRAIVFTNRRDQAQKLSDRLHRRNIPCALLSGALSQNVRTRMLREFKEGKYHILVATDVAGRGLHIEDVSHVINYHIPHEADAYVHRIGRTGRAGKSGISISFADEEDSFYIPDIEEYMGASLNCTYPDERHLAPPDDNSDNKKS